MLAHPLEIILDELINRHGIRTVLQALAISCEFEDDQARDAWDGPEEAFDPAWQRIAARISRIAANVEVTKR